MADESQHAHQAREESKKSQPEQSDSGEESGVLTATSTREASLGTGSPRPGKPAAMFSSMDSTQRTRAVIQLQHAHGNSYVQRMVHQYSSSKPHAGNEISGRIQEESGGVQNPVGYVEQDINTSIGSDFSPANLPAEAAADPLVRSVDNVPLTQEGLHPQTHQAASILQRAKGVEDGRTAAGTITINSPSDRVEPADERSGSRMMSIGVQTFPEQTNQRTLQRTRVIQRYQAGDEGHGGIEKDALTDIGFTKDEANQVYFGNWLRDFSQIPPKALPIINILALGEFNRTVTQADLGAYVPSEHLDNPLGGGTIEDPLKYPKHPMTDAEIDQAVRDNNLSPAQAEAFKQEEKHSADILAASRSSGLPVYIERGKFKAKQTLEKAILAKATPEGRALMGSALHAIEDYFSHSNFVEAAIMTLQKEGVGGTKVDTLVKKLKKTHLGTSAVTFDPKTGQPEIVTGTYAGKANSTVSLLETLKTEVQHGQFTRAFMLGLLRQGGIGLEEIGRRMGEKAGIIGGVIGGVGGAVGGAVSGAKAGYDSGGTIGGIIGGVLGGIRGGISGARTGSRIASGIGGAIGSGVGKFLDLLAVEALEVILAALLALGFVFNLTPYSLLMEAIIDEKVKEKTLESAKEAPVDPTTGKKGPTHSEIAKDAPDNPLFGVSAHLAGEADKEIGIAMQAVWSAGASGAVVSPDPVTKLVDKFVSVPAHDSWWRTKILDAIK